MEIYIILVSLILVLSYLVINLYRKNIKLEETVSDIVNIDDTVLAFLESLLVTYTKAFAELTRIDKLGSFKSDDETGFIFKTIMKTIEDIKNQIDDVILKVNLKEESE